MTYPKTFGLDLSTLGGVHSRGTSHRKNPRSSRGASPPPLLPSCLPSTRASGSFASFSSSSAISTHVIRSRWPGAHERAPSAQEIKIQIVNEKRPRDNHQARPSLSPCTSMSKHKDQHSFPRKNERATDPGIGWCRAKKKGKEGIPSRPPPPPTPCDARHVTGNKCYQVDKLQVEPTPSR